jgi:hypothetical protein
VEIKQKGTNQFNTSNSKNQNNLEAVQAQITTEQQPNQPSLHNKETRQYQIQLIPASQKPRHQY